MFWDVIEHFFFYIPLNLGMFWEIKDALVGSGGFGTFWDILGNFGKFLGCFEGIFERLRTF